MLTFTMTFKLVIWLQTVFYKADLDMICPFIYTEVVHNYKSHRPHLWSLPTSTLKNTPPSRKRKQTNQQCAHMKGYFKQMKAAFLMCTFK
jgi:hypothetical protein